MSDSGDQWRIELAVPAAAAQVFEDALEPFCEALSRFVDGDGPDWQLEGFSRAAPDQKALGLALEIVSAAMGVNVPEFHISKVPSRDWLVENLKDFPPLTVGRFFIHGGHFEGDIPPGKTALRMDAGAAFGTGQHATTEGCLRALDDLVRRRRFTNPLDMGCGSGLLALALAKRLQVGVTAADVDARAVGVAIGNARLNGQANRVRVMRSDGYRHREISRAGPFDLIVANILANPICAMAGDLSRNLAPGGVAVLSGFNGRDANRVFAAHRGRGLRLVRRISLNGWRTLVLGK